MHKQVRQGAGEGEAATGFGGAGALEGVLSVTAYLEQVDGDGDGGPLQALCRRMSESTEAMEGEAHRGVGGQTDKRKGWISIQWAEARKQSGHIDVNASSSVSASLTL